MVKKGQIREVSMNFDVLTIKKNINENENKEEKEEENYKDHRLQIKKLNGEKRELKVFKLQPLWCNFC